MAPRSQAFYYLFATHHLLARSKQSDLRAWSKELGLVGLAKRGYPGIILLTAVDNGAQDRLADVAQRIKSLRWASQDSRPIQALPPPQAAALRAALAQSQGLPDDKGASHLLAFLDSMKAISEVLRRADSLADGRDASPGSETWMDRWRREMKPS